MTTLLVILITAAGFLAVILSLALSAGFKNRIMGVCGAIALSVGVVSYGYAYSQSMGLTAATVLKTLLTVCRMFGGVNDFGAVSALPLFQHPLMVTLFWAGHFMAFYLTASAAIEVLGKRLLKHIRLRVLQRRNLSLIYDPTPTAIRLVRHQKGDPAVALICEGNSAALGDIAQSLNGVAFDGGIAGCATPEFLRRLGVRGGGRELDVYCMGGDGPRNLRFAEAVAQSLGALDVDPGRASLFLLGVPEQRAAHLLALEGRAGFGSVFACEPYELIARLAAQKCPPWRCIPCDEMGRATRDFRVLIAGFGRMGRAVLRQTIMNGQMEGSIFHADVFDRRMQDLEGYMKAAYPELLREYDIAMFANDANSAAFFQRLEERPPSLIVLCTGDAKGNAELALDLERLYAGRADRPPIVQCAADGVTVDEEAYRLENLDVRGMDRGAMALNHIYTRGPSAEADWRRCDAFSRASSRASVDFLPAYLYASGVSREEALAGRWPPPADVLENLSRTEHLRWCAFHLAMGYAPMSDAEFEERAGRYRGGERLRLAKNPQAMTHACLVPWEALDALSDKENAVTGGTVDYKAYDRDNVIALPQMLGEI